MLYGNETIHGVVAVGVFLFVEVPQGRPVRPLRPIQHIATAVENLWGTVAAMISSPAIELLLAHPFPSLRR